MSFTKRKRGSFYGILVILGALAIVLLILSVIPGLFLNTATIPAGGSRGGGNGEGNDGSGSGSSSSVTNSTTSSVASNGNETTTSTGTSTRVTQSNSSSSTSNQAALQPDFSITASPSYLTLIIDGSGMSALTVNSTNGFNSTVALSATAAVNGVSISIASNPVSLQTSGTAPSSINLTLLPFVTPQTFTLNVTGTSASSKLSYTTSLMVTVEASSFGIANVIGSLHEAGCIDNSGIANAFTSKLSAVQSAINSSNSETATNILGAMIHQINAQSGKHIESSCTIAGTTFNPSTILMTDVWSLTDNLNASGKDNPALGFVVGSSLAGVLGTILSLFVPSVRGSFMAKKLTRLGHINF